MEEELGTEEAAVKETTKKDPFRSVSQANFRPTPYKAEEWEVVGERLPDLGFIPMEVHIVETEAPEPDEMFENFDTKSISGKESVFHSPDLTLREIEAAQQGEVIDEAVLEAAKAEAYEAGREAGIAEGYELGKAEVAEKYLDLQQQVANLSKEVLSRTEGFFAEIDKRALDFTLQVSKKILQTTADVKPEYIYEVIKKGLQSLGASTPLRIRVSPQDLEFLEVVGLPEELQTSELGVSYVADDSVKSGCVIETNFGEVDLQLESMWEQVAVNLYEVTKG